MKEKSKKTVLFFRASDQFIERLNEIKDRREFYSNSEALRYCVVETHARLFKDYVEIQKNRPSLLSPEQIAARKMAISDTVKREKDGRENARIQNLVTALDGTLDGNLCTYFMYSLSPNKKWVAKSTISVLANELSEDDVGRQYKDVEGNNAKEEILALLAEGIEIRDFT